MDIEQAAKQLEALGNPTRLEVYRTLVRAGTDGLAVSGVQQKIGIPASTLSHHLHRLILTGLVTQERQATTLICRADYPAMQGLVGFLVDECCADAHGSTAADDAALGVVPREFQISGDIGESAMAIPSRPSRFRPSSEPMSSR